MSFSTEVRTASDGDESLEEGQVVLDDKARACACLLALRSFRHTQPNEHVLNFVPTLKHPSPDWHFILHEPHAFPLLPFQDILAIIREEHTCPYERIATDLNPRATLERSHAYERMVIEVEFEGRVLRGVAVKTLLDHLHKRFDRTETGAWKVQGVWETIAMETDRRGGLKARFEMDVCTSACESVICQLMANSSADAITLLYAGTPEHNVDGDNPLRQALSRSTGRRTSRVKIPLRVSPPPRTIRHASPSPQARHRSPLYSRSREHVHREYKRTRSPSPDRRSPSPSSVSSKMRGWGARTNIAQERLKTREPRSQSRYHDLDRPSRSTTKDSLKYEWPVERRGTREVKRGRSRSPVRKETRPRLPSVAHRPRTPPADDSASDELQTPEMGIPLPLITPPLTHPRRRMNASDFLDSDDECSANSSDEPAETYTDGTDSASLQLAAIESNSLGLLDFIGMSSASSPMPILIRANVSDLTSSMRKNDVRKECIASDDIAPLVIGALHLKGLVHSSQLTARGTRHRKTGLFGWSTQWHEFAATVGREVML
ncbi:hypothetical protein CALVIDRAFT_217485 [Calocera viscosa TUFC12733]|uniref:Uncharacterized protein n=1 Tax=Calocera viscosa (strain TUFC12733) TaxID=1330018 RepID=A0A167RHR9_CALVF|nr:hypothetical protein CALVIDRAFT_217485 [Calocera viscosa TUFC12733]